MKIKETTGWFWNASRGARACIVLNGCALVLHVAASLLFIAVSKHLIDIATGRLEGNLALDIALMACCMLAQIAMSSLSSRYEAKSGILIVNRLRYGLFTQLMDSRLTGRDSLHSGDIINRMESDVQIAANILTSTIPAVAACCLRMIAAFVFLCMLDVRLAAVCVCIMPAMLLIGGRFALKMRRMTKELRATDSRVQAHVQENLQRRLVISAMEHGPQVASALDSLQDDLERKTMRRADYALLWRVAIQGGFAVGYMIAFCWGIFGIKSGAVTFGMMTAFLQLVSQVQRPIVDLARQIPTFAQAAISAERLAEISDLPREEKGEPVNLGESVGLRMQGVNFTYPDGGGQVIDDFSHDFKPGTITAIIGETGAGKSTLSKLMLALQNPDSGSVSLYNDLTEVQASSRTRCNFVYVPQGNTLLSGTIRDNLLMARPEATDDELRDALHMAVADFVYDLPDGIDTICAELGNGLSEGQCQRIAIARGLLRRGAILLLDEPTSSLDAQTEKQLLERLSAKLGGRTMIMITHRAPVAQLCPEVVRINKL